MSLCPSVVSWGVGQLLLGKNNPRKKSVTPHLFCTISYGIFNWFRIYDQSSPEFLSCATKIGHNLFSDKFFFGYDTLWHLHFFRYWCWAKKPDASEIKLSPQWTPQTIPQPTRWFFCVRNRDATFQNLSIFQDLLLNHTGCSTLISTQ